MVPFDVNLPGGTRAKVTWDSIIWFGVVTTAASILGSYLWEYVIQPNLSAPPAPGTNKLTGPAS